MVFKVVSIVDVFVQYWVDLVVEIVFIFDCVKQCQWDVCQLGGGDGQMWIFVGGNVFGLDRLIIVCCVKWLVGKVDVV